MRHFLFNTLAVSTLILATTGILFGQSGEELREEFHKIFPLKIDGSVSLVNFNGTVRFLSWDRNEIKIDAVKCAISRERLDEAVIEADTNSEEARIRTKYPENACGCEDLARIDYTITVPHKARLSEVRISKGTLEIDGLGGDVKISLVDVNLKARGLKGSAKIKTVDGRLELFFDRVNESQSVLVESVNAPIVLTIPPDSSLQLDAVSARGDVSNDFDLKVNKSVMGRHDPTWRLGSGNAKIELNSINGSITIHRGQN